MAILLAPSILIATAVWEDEDVFVVALRLVIRDRVCANETAGASKRQVMTRIINRFMKPSVSLRLHADTILNCTLAMSEQRTLKVERLGRVEYGAALDIQKQTERAVLTNAQPDT